MTSPFLSVFPIFPMPSPETQSTLYPPGGNDVAIDDDEEDDDDGDVNNDEDGDNYDDNNDDDDVKDRLCLFSLAVTNPGLK